VIKSLLEKKPAKEKKPTSTDKPASTEKKTVPKPLKKAVKAPKKSKKKLDQPMLLIPQVLQVMVF